jgi:hypothetical protein
LIIPQKIPVFFAQRKPVSFLINKTKGFVALPGNGDHQDRGLVQPLDLAHLDLFRFEPRVPDLINDYRHGISHTQPIDASSFPDIPVIIAGINPQSALPAHAGNGEATGYQKKASHMAGWMKVSGICQQGYENATNHLKMTNLILRAPVFPVSLP